MKRISSRDNPTFKALRSLVDDHREPRRRGETIVDGIHLVHTCLERGIELRQVVVSESGLLHPGITALLERITAPCLEFTDNLFREATGMTSPTGIAAVIAIPVTQESSASGDMLLLDAVQDAGNVGTLIRTAAAAGVRDILLGPGCAGAWTPRVLRAGQGAHFGVRIHEQVALHDAIAGFNGAVLATVVSDGCCLYDIDLAPPVAWLFGNEGAGLSSSLVVVATQRVTIPMATTTESLNVAAAAAVCLFEANRQRRR